MLRKMKNILKKIKLRKLSLIQGVALGLFINLIAVFKTHAQTSYITSKIIYGIFSWISHLIALIASQIIILEAKILALIINASVFTKMPVVQTGWRIARDFTNILFIIILIYIAFSYILRVQSRATKGLLVKMIIMAILINFSLMIGGAIIDFSNMFFRYFIFGSLGGDPSGLSGVRFTNALANALNLQTFMQSQSVQEPTATSTEAEWQAWVTSQMAGAQEKTALMGIAKLMFTIIFSFLMIIIFGALIGILFVRLFWLWILLIFAPLAWVISLISIPGTPGNIAKQWWDKFLQWCFVAPVMGFFIYLALETASHVERLTIPDRIVTGMSAVMYNLQEIMQMFLVAGFIIAGLIAGEKMGAKIAAKAHGIATSAGNKVKGAVKSKASLWALRAANAPATGLEKAASKSDWAKAVIGVTGLGMASRYISRKADEAQQKEWSEKVKKYDSVTTEQLKKMADSAIMPKETAAMYAVLAKREEINDSNKDKAIPLLKKYDPNTYKSLLDKRPDWNPEFKSAAQTGGVQAVVKKMEEKNTDSSKLNLAKIKDPVILEAALRFKIQTDAEEAGRALRNLKLDVLNQFTEQIKEEFNKLDKISQEEFAKKMKSGLSGRIWFTQHLEVKEEKPKEEPKVKLYDSGGREIS